MEINDLVYSKSNRHIGISFPQWLIESDYHEDGRVDETEDAKKSHSAVKVNRPEIFELNP